MAADTLTRLNSQEESIASTIDNGSPVELNQRFEELLEKFNHKFDKGDVLPAIVAGYEGNGLMIDVGAKTLAFMPPKEIDFQPLENLQESMPIGHKLEVLILRYHDDDERLIVSRKRVAQARAWDDLKEIYEEGGVLECVITSTVKGGVLVDAKGVRGFVPASHLRLREQLDDLTGKSIPLKILSIEPQENNLILSHKKVVNEQLAEQRAGIFDNLAVGTLVEGVVVRLTDFGAFIDLGGVDGLLPLSQMSWRWVEHPSDLLKIGDSVRVEVISVDAERQRVSLSVKSQYEDPWNLVGNELGYGDQVEGTITRIKHFGAFVEVFPGVEALLPSKELTEQESTIGEQLNQGDRIAVFISKFSPDERRIALSFTSPTGESVQPVEQVVDEADVEEAVES